jgi:tRNA (Thr-GGU) A37 N-methylase
LLQTAGTPRQGVLVPSSRGVIKIDDVLGADGLDGLEAFSHVWLLYVFHKNTNFFKHERAHREALAVAADPGVIRHKKPKFRFTV